MGYQLCVRSGESKPSFLVCCRRSITYARRDDLSSLDAYHVSALLFSELVPYLLFDVVVGFVTQLTCEFLRTLIA